VDVLSFLHRLRIRYYHPAASMESQSYNIIPIETDDPSAVSQKGRNRSSKGGNSSKNNRSNSGGVFLQDDTIRQGKMIDRLVLAIEQRRNLEEGKLNNENTLSMIAITDEAFEEHVLQFVQFCIDADTTLSFRAAINLAERLNKSDILPEVSFYSILHLTDLLIHALVL